MTPRVYLGMPHSAFIFPSALQAFAKPASVPCMQVAMGNSTLTHNFNALWCDALNHRASHGVNVFAMCHYDVQPERLWIDILLEEMENRDADIVSAVIPIKDERGLTSTGVGLVGEHGVCRMTMRELEGFPETFSIDDLPTPPGNWYLAVNTGLWIARIDRPWVRYFPGFKVDNLIEWNDDGTCKPAFRPEDWLLSEWAHINRLRVVATQRVKLGHWGFAEYRNDKVWGTWDTDEQHQPRKQVNNVYHSLASTGCDTER